MSLYKVVTAYGSTYVITSDFSKVEELFKLKNHNRFTQIIRIEFISSNVVVGEEE